MIRTEFLLAVFVCIQCHTLVCSGLSDLSGKEFVLSFPTFSTTDRQVHFFIYTLEVLKTIEVHFFTKWTSVKDLEINTTFLINREEMKHYISTEKFTFLTENELKLDYGKGLLLYSLPRTDISEKYTYVLTSENRFYVSVHIVDKSNGKTNMASLQAVPTEGWGTSYIAVTLSYQPSIQIVTAEENKVSITIKANNQFYVRYNEMYYSNWGFMSIHLEPYKGFSLQACPFTQHDYGSMTGTEIRGQKPFGLISGNCAGYEVGLNCAKGGGKGDMVMEMLLPIDTYATFYILYGIENYGLYVVVADAGNTSVQHFYQQLTNKSMIEYRGQYITIPGQNDIHFLTSNKPVGVYYILQNGCGDVTSNSALTLVVPTGLFMDVYIWRTIETEEMKSVGMKHHISYVCLVADSTTSLVLDNVKLNKYAQTTMNGEFLNRNWQVGIMQIQPGMHEFFSTRSAKFGVYAFGGAKTAAYIYTAGFISGQLNRATPCKPTGSKRPVRGDLIDDDCDGFIDEERFDNLDEDSDGLKDEDIMPLAPRNGSWGEWNPWWCSNCFSSNKTRTRQCNDPVPIRGGHNCPGMNLNRIESSPGGCQNICKDVHGGWSEWQRWTCISPCNISVRTRKCDNPAPKFNGWNCKGISEEKQIGVCHGTCQYDTKPSTTTTTTKVLTSTRKTSYTTSKSTVKTSSTGRLTTSGKETTTSRGWATSSTRWTTSSTRWTTSSRRWTTTSLNGTRSSEKWTSTRTLTTTARNTTTERAKSNQTSTTKAGATTKYKGNSTQITTTTGRAPTTGNGTTLGKSTTAGNTTVNSTLFNTTSGPGTTKLAGEFTSSNTSETPENITTTATTDMSVTEPTTVEYTTLDYSEAPPRDGMWSQWSNWTCPQNCHDKKMIRSRLCDNPSPDHGGLECLGPPYQHTEDDMCQTVCADDCPDHQWGLNCTNHCPHCEDSCDKNTGACKSCKPGWHIASRSCTFECDMFFYGYDCRGSCIIDCAGMDCLERVTGTCPAKAGGRYYWYLLLLLLIPMAILCYLPQKYKKQYDYWPEEEGNFYVEDLTDYTVKVEEKALIQPSRHTVASDDLMTEIF